MHIEQLIYGSISNYQRKELKHYSKQFPKSWYTVKSGQSTKMHVLPVWQTSVCIQKTEMQQNLRHKEAVQGSFLPDSVTTQTACHNVYVEIKRWNLPEWKWKRTYRTNANGSTARMQYAEKAPPLRACRLPMQRDSEMSVQGLRRMLMEVLK